MPPNKIAFNKFATNTRRLIPNCGYSSSTCTLAQFSFLANIGRTHQNKSLPLRNNVSLLSVQLPQNCAKSLSTFSISSQSSNEYNVIEPVDSKSLEDKQSETISQIDPHALSQNSPKWSFHKRVLPTNLTALSSPDGKRLFLQSLTDGYAESYFPLAEQFLTQGEPAYCGLSTLVMVLNALSIDPNVRWKSGWRWFDDEMIMDGCCLDKKVVKEVGITMDQFKMMGRCKGAIVDMYRPDKSRIHAVDSPNATKERRKSKKQHKEKTGDINIFREHVKKYVQNDHADSPGAFLVASYLRSALGQTGGGHFSPIAAYHVDTDQVLILDVARFKYTPHWVSLSQLFEAMTYIDDTTDLNRGWFMVHAPLKNNAIKEEGDKKRPAELVQMGKDGCPLGDIKVHFCSARNDYQSKKQM